MELIDTGFTNDTIAKDFFDIRKHVVILQGLGVGPENLCFSSVKKKFTYFFIYFLGWRMQARLDQNQLLLCPSILP